MLEIAEYQWVLNKEKNKHFCI